ncbi:MAG: PKD domain-containing protein, partial [Thermoplasmata archaeon]
MKLNPLSSIPSFSISNGTYFNFQQSLTHPQNYIFLFFFLSHGEIMKRSIFILVVFCVVALSITPEFAHALGPEQKAENTAATRGTTQVFVTIYKIDGVDPVDSLDDEDWYYHVGCWWEGESEIHWQSSQEPIQSNTDPLVVNKMHTFTVNSLEVKIFIMLCEDDSLEFGGFPDDLADISDDRDGGYDNVGSSIQPPGGLYRYWGTYVGIYDLSTGALSGNTTVIDGGYYKTSGDFDGSTGVDENDAHLWFTISDNYAPPSAYAGPDKTARRGETVSFDGSGSTASQGSSITEYLWDIDNDGTWDGSGMIFTFNIPTSFPVGSHTVKLQVRDNYGMISTDFCTLTVANTNPTAAFTFTPENPTTSDTIQFTDTSTDSDGTITSWSWDFGDGTQSTQRNPTHRYSTKGTYTVRLTVTDNDGGTAT